MFGRGELRTILRDWMRCFPKDQWLLVLKDRHWWVLFGLAQFHVVLNRSAVTALRALNSQDSCMAFLIVFTCMSGVFVPLGIYLHWRQGQHDRRKELQHQNGTPELWMPTNANANANMMPWEAMETTPAAVSTTVITSPSFSSCSVHEKALYHEASASSVTHTHTQTQTTPRPKPRPRPRPISTLMQRPGKALNSSASRPPPRRPSVWHYLLYAMLFLAYTCAAYAFPKVCLFTTRPSYLLRITSLYIWMWSYFFLHRRYAWNHFVGVVLVLTTTMVLCLEKWYLYQHTRAKVNISLVTESVAFLAILLLSSFSVYREWLLKLRRGDDDEEQEGGSAYEGTLGNARTLRNAVFCEATTRNFGLNFVPQYTPTQTQHGTQASMKQMANKRDGGDADISTSSPLSIHSSSNNGDWIAIVDFLAYTSLFILLLGFLVTFFMQGNPFFHKTVWTPDLMYGHLVRVIQFIAVQSLDVYFVAHADAVGLSLHGATQLFYNDLLGILFPRWSSPDLRLTCIGSIGFLLHLVGIATYSMTMPRFRMPQKPNEFGFTSSGTHNRSGLNSDFNMNRHQFQRGLNNCLEDRPHD